MPQGLWTALRFVDEDTYSGADIETRVQGLLWCSLLEVQVEVPSAR